MFPDFNIYSTPLLILVLQGLILVGMLLKKANSIKDSSCLILATLLLITCYHRITYTIGFMGWYDTFKYTKINYFVIQLVLGIGPLIYLYIKSISEKRFQLDRKAAYHFIPLIFYIIFNLGMLIYDSNQIDFDLTQNGILLQWVLEHLLPIISLVFSLHLLIYLIFSILLYYKIRSRLEHEFSDTYRFEMLWLRNFLFLFSFLFAFDAIQMLTEGFIFELHWTQEWWLEFFSLLVVLYVGLKGYFTPIEHLPRLEPEMLNFIPTIENNTSSTTIEIHEKLHVIVKKVEKEKLYLDSDLTLTKLAKKLKLPPSQLSLIINKGRGQNFNEFINNYRVLSIKEKLQSDSFDHLSILAIALDSGFNSKATFNRVFKKIDGNPPSFYRK